ncbi:5-oxoprolinase subunit PxpB [Aestuariibaculum sediminum]|uniref:5-oxoprolinase subunit PxpB n=1 Tax=Aestuariibaculum sediminum TaxID=2770637 RepID=A0A8J6U831_9FLAO|nr:5-oxoprolinase subunit PxpB [Aestuariibaculum sediminum]MBD0832755.1 5-oxoprolinase subunit PxpB [Aestuariibaculum sediminum]
MSYNLTYKPFGERAILIEWPNKIEDDILHDILGFKEKLFKLLIKELLYVNHAYNSLIVFYKNKIPDFEAKKSTINKIYIDKNDDVSLSVIKWVIPVCYDDIFGLDLTELSIEKDLSKAEVIQLHSEAVYKIYFIGFLPGFLYLGGLNEKLFTPRKATPRLRVEKGAVAIGGNQTGVYPVASPGGWNVIGNSPVSFFNLNNDKPCFAQPGDFIKFKPVSLKEYNDIKILCEAGVYELESEVIHG